MKLNVEHDNANQVEEQKTSQIHLTDQSLIRSQLKQPVASASRLFKRISSSSDQQSTHLQPTVAVVANSSLSNKKPLKSDINKRSIDLKHQTTTTTTSSNIIASARRKLPLATITPQQQQKDHTNSKTILVVDKKSSQISDIKSGFKLKSNVPCSITKKQTNSTGKECNITVKQLEPNQSVRTSTLSTSKSQQALSGK